MTPADALSTESGEVNESRGAATETESAASGIRGPSNSAWVKDMREGGRGSRKEAKV